MRAPKAVRDALRSCRRLRVVLNCFDTSNWKMRKSSTRNGSPESLLVSVTTKKMSVVSE